MKKRLEDYLTNAIIFSESALSNWDIQTAISILMEASIKEKLEQEIDTNLSWQLLAEKKPVQIFFTYNKTGLFNHMDTNLSPQITIFDNFTDNPLPIIIIFIK